MNKTLKALIRKYGTEEIIARILEQLKLLVETEDEEVRKAVKDLILDSGSDTEYIFNLCEYTNLVTYVSDRTYISDKPETESNTTELPI